MTHNYNATAYSKMKYDKIFTNIGMGYDVNSGVFTVPTSGVYMFHIHALTQSGESMKLDLYRFVFSF